MINNKSAALAASLALLLGACSSTPMAPPTPAPAPSKAAMAPAPAAPAPAAVPTATAPVSAVTTVTLPPYLDPKSSISTERSIYFAFDDYSVSSDFNTLVERQGKFLASSPTVNVKIEGNADERGGAEYNLALGQKRAEAVLKALRIYGARDSQMEAVSWGDTKPKAPGHDEAAWAQNRRADLQYPTK